ncbi:hypothetical protein [Bacillus cereus]|uniref:hypothetical protein n=1 Tax=Bacillus cereus TaxID=1396 RepID=UPI000B4B957A|nr:hypothetical protein [Bacillus cereus]
MDIIRSFSDEPLFDTTIGELLEDIQNKIHYVQSEGFQSYLCDILKLDNIQDIDEKTFPFSDNLSEGNEVFKNLIYPFSERHHSLFLFYFNKFVNKQSPVKPRPDKDFDKESFVQDLIIHYNQFTKLLYGYGNVINPTRDILELERETDIYFLLKTCSLLPKDKLDKFKYKKDKNNYLKVLASLSVIEDIRLKLYFIEQFIKEDNSFSFTKGKGYIELFVLIFLYVPLLKEYLLDEIRAPKGVLSIKSDEVSDKEEASKLKGIKKKLFLYQSLKCASGYKLTDLRYESVFQIDESKVNYSEEFIEFYKKVKKVNGFRREFCKEAIEDLFKIIRKEPDSIEAYLYYIAREFVHQGEYLALKLDKDLGLEEKIQVFNRFDVDPILIKEKFNNVNIDTDKLLEGKK